MKTKADGLNERGHQIMNEYARLAQSKPMEARTTAEMVAACYNLTEEKANEIAGRIDSAPSVKSAIMQLPKKSAGTFDIYDLCEEIKTRKNANTMGDA